MNTVFGDDEIYTLDAAVNLVSTLERVINELNIFTRRVDYYPFDSVAGETSRRRFLSVEQRSL